MAAPPIVGLDIGTQQIKVVELRSGKNGLVVSALGVAPTPVGVMQNNIITDPKLMGQSIKQLLKESGISAKKTVGSVAGQSAVVIRIIEVPRMTDAELAETMKWEVERHVPFAPSETVMDYQALPPSGPPSEDNPNMEVLLAVAQQDIIANFVDTLFAAGLDPIAIDIEPLAVARALLDIENGKPVVRPQVIAPALAPAEDEFTGDFPETEPSETVAVVNIGAANTDIAIYQGGQLVFPRSLPLAGDSLTRAIGEILGYPMDQAERVKRDYGEVQLERMGLYTGTAYGDDAGYEMPQFQDDNTAFLGDAEDAPMRSPFDTSPEPAATSEENPFGTNPFGANPFLTTPEGPQFDEPERTQPIPRRTLNLAARQEAPSGAFSFMPPTGEDAGFGGAGGLGGVNEEAMREQVFSAIAPVLGELATELRRSLDYYRSRAQGRSVDRLLLAGGSASLANFAPFLQNELQVPVSLAAPLAGLEVASKNYDPSYLNTIAPTFTVALGLAARNAVLEANPAPKPAKAPRAPKLKKGAASPVAS